MDEPRQDAEPEAPEPSVPAVGIGASAGGIEAMRDLLPLVPADSGAAWIVVLHLPRAVKGEHLLPRTLSGFSPLPVEEIRDGLELAADRLFVGPPGGRVEVADGRFRVTPLAAGESPLTIDPFLHSLARSHGGSAAGVILSGAGSDGALGLRAIRAQGGLALVQEAGSATFDGMPTAGLALGAADAALPLEDIPRRVVDFFRTGRPQPIEARAIAREDLRVQLAQVFRLLRRRTGHDFSLYKQKTVLRRIQRRMLLAQLPDLEGYVALLEQQPREVDQLFQDLTIGVTQFFRDPGAFDALAEKVLPDLLTEARASSGLRCWVPGCSTGEEAYSLAILMLEHLRARDLALRPVIFATDINPGAIEAAREGLYPEEAMAEIPEARRARYFVQDRSGWRVAREVRDLIIFAPQNVLTDAPFSRLDLISCRDLLIYFGLEAQRMVLPLFHYALKPEGYLFLGASETIGKFGNLFSPVDKRWRIFRRRSGPDQAFFHLALARMRRAGSAASSPDAPPVKVDELATRSLLREFTPPAVVINPAFEIVHYHGRTARYLQPPVGEPTNNLLKLAREGLALEIRSAVQRAVREDGTVLQRGVTVGTDAGSERVDLVVKPLAAGRDPSNLLLVVFRESPAASSPAPAPAADRDGIILHLEEELRVTRETLQTTVEELETSNEELLSSNEELMSLNEELQSTNEELETSKEELQAINEELSTVNAELQQRVEEAVRSGRDLQNLLDSTRVATLFLDAQLRIQRFTPEVARLFHIIDTDLGRPLAHLTRNFTPEDLLDDARRSLREPVADRPVRTPDGRRFFVRFSPYRAEAGASEGVILTFVEDLSREG